jgi:hypothetical protein
MDQNIDGANRTIFMENTIGPNVVVNDNPIDGAQCLAPISRQARDKSPNWLAIGRQRHRHGLGFINLGGRVGRAQKLV